MKTRVKFVMIPADEDGDAEVCAVFPDESWTGDADSVATYVHCGQHGGGNRRYLDILRPATEEEYTPLLKELTNLVGYKNLEVI